MTSEPPTFDQVKDYARRDAFAIGWQARQAMQLSHSTAIAFDIVLKSSCYWHETKTTLSEALGDWEQRHHGVGWFFYCTRFSTYNATYNDMSALPVFTTSTTSEVIGRGSGGSSERGAKRKRFADKGTA